MLKATNASLVAVLAEDAEVEMYPALVLGCIFEHGEEVEPLRVDEGVGDELFEDDGVEAVEVFGYLSHNDIIKYGCFQY